MNSLLKKPDPIIEKLAGWRLFKSDFDYHLVRASMVFIFLILDTRNGSSTRPTSGRRPSST
jgi:hypothetical protein